MVEGDVIRYDKDDPRNKPRKETPGLVEKLESMGFRPFGVEW
jgi:hypothetical protein